jgi:hypothetical protein
VGNHLTRALAYEQRTLRLAMASAGIDLPREAAVRIVAELHGSGHEIAPFTPDAHDAHYRAKWTDQAAPVDDTRGPRLVPRRDPHLCWRVHPGDQEACQMPDGHDLPQAGD